MKKHCSRCRLEKPIAEFGRKTRGLYQPYCRPCQAAYKQEHYAKNKSEYVAGVRRRRKAVLIELRRLKEERPCADCGVQYPYYVMDFDHREGEQKNGNLTHLIVGKGYTREKMLAEIAKCDLVCANCHRVRTFQRRQYRRQVASTNNNTQAT